MPQKMTIRIINGRLKTGLLLQRVKEIINLPEEEISHVNEITKNIVSQYRHTICL